MVKEEDMAEFEYFINRSWSSHRMYVRPSSNSRNRMRITSYVDPDELETLQYLRDEYCNIKFRQAEQTDIYSGIIDREQAEEAETIKVSSLLIKFHKRTKNVQKILRTINKFSELKVLKINCGHNQKLLNCAIENNHTVDHLMIDNIPANNERMGVIPNFISSFKALTHLLIGSRHINYVPDFFSRFSGLEKLQIENGIREAPDFLLRLPNLNFLSLNLRACNNLAEFIYEAYSSKIEELHLHYNSNQPAIILRKMGSGEFQVRDLLDIFYKQSYIGLSEHAETFVKESIELIINILGTSLFDGLLTDEFHLYFPILMGFLENSPHLIVDKYWLWHDNLTDSQKNNEAVSLMHQYFSRTTTIAEIGGDALLL